MSDSFALVTGPIQGVVTVDGNEVNVTPDVIYLDSAEAVAAVCHQIGLHYAENGHPKVEGDFRYDAPEES